MCGLAISYAAKRLQETVSINSLTRCENLKLGEIRCCHKTLRNPDNISTKDGCRLCEYHGIVSGRNDKAFEQYKEAIRLDPKLAVAHYNLGLSFYRNKQFDDSISAYLKAVDLKPNYADAWYNLGMAQAEVSDFEQAVESYRLSVGINPDHQQARQRLEALEQK